MINWVAPPVRLGDLEFFISQGGMGVNISADMLASAVANEGGLGTISPIGLGEARGYSGDYREASIQAFKDVIANAQKLRNGRGALAVNIMRAVTDYPEFVKVAIESKLAAIISGAGMPLDLPAYKPSSSNTKLIPVVSSPQAARIIIKYWQKKYNYTPDALLVEGPEAGGHLGFKLEQIFDPAYSLEKIIPQIVDESKKISGRDIPVIAAGGIYYGGDIRKFLNLGATGVQLATRFVTTEECDANVKFKQAYLDCKKEDIMIIKSPVGMPGRAIRNSFLEKVESGTKMNIACKYQCLISCDIKEARYCIAKALVNAQKGELGDYGYVFCGSNAWRTKEDGIISVHKLFEKLNQEYLDDKRSD